MKGPVTSMDLQPQVWRVGEREELVVMRLADYKKLQQALEDAEDVRDLRAARKSNKGTRRYTIDEARAELGLAKTSRRKAPKKTSRSK